MQKIYPLTHENVSVLNALCCPLPGVRVLNQCVNAGFYWVRAITKWHYQTLNLTALISELRLAFESQSDLDFQITNDQ
jgi:hypothetical protein